MHRLPTALTSCVRAALLAAAVVLATFAGLRGAAAQDGGGDPSAKLGKVAFEAATVERGGKVRLRVEIECALGSHVYAQSESDVKRPVFKWTLPPGWTAGPVEDVTHPHEFTGFGDKEMVLDGVAVIAQTFTIGADAALGKVEVKGLGAWQVCTASMCAFETDVPMAATVEVVAGSVAQAAPQPPAPEPPARSGAAPAPDDGEPAGWGGILGQAVFWGLLTVLTPCVFPLLPVTVSFFSKQKGPALPRALVYGAGIVFTITVIGLIFKSSLDVMARGWQFNLAIGVLFLALALSLFGLFDLKLPGFLTDWSSSRSGGGGLLGPFFMAVTLALTSFSCSMPFLAAMFTQFDRGNYVQSVAGLVVYGTTMALPFFLCSLFPSALAAVPRAGAWMNAIKVTMGFVEFALAFKFLRTVDLQFGWGYLPRGFVLAIWAACALGAALYLFGWVVLPHDTKPESIGVFRLVFAIGFLASAIYVLPGVNGRPLADWIEGFIQGGIEVSGAEGARDPGGGGETAHIAWMKNDWDGALARARAEGKPVLIDFTGVG